MKRLILLTTILLTAAPRLAAAPKWTKQATKGLLTLHAIQPQGDTLVANAFFLGEDGQVVAPYKAVCKARQAWVTNAQDKRFEVSRIMGFNATYDVVRLKADVGKKKADGLTVSPEKPKKEATVVLMPQATDSRITQVERAGDYEYYTLESKARKELAGMPVMSEDGQVVAIAQTPILAGNAPLYALDIRFACALAIRPIDANHADLRDCAIPKQLPTDESEATNFLFLVRTADRSLQSAYADDFIQAFPGNATGYIQKAELQAEAGDYKGAFDTYETALRQCASQHDELLYARSRMMYGAIVQTAQGVPEDWTLERAYEDAARAYETNPLPLYILHEANILFAQKEYDKAYQHYMALTQTNMRTPELFMYASQCRQNAGAEKEELLALCDSALGCFTKPYGSQAAPYLLLRAGTLQDMNRLREAIRDLNDYEHLMQERLNAAFYYQREQMESQTRMFAPAVNDIQKAISIDPNEPTYHAELAALLFRLNDTDGAIASCQKAVALKDDFPDAYRIWGICLREKGDTEGARQQLQKAMSLGDEMAKSILEKL